TGSVNAPVPAFTSPLPSVTEPFHSTSACRSNVAINLPPKRFEVQGSRFWVRLLVTGYWLLPTGSSTLSAGDRQLHAEAQEAETDPRDRHPAASGRRRQRVENPHVAGRGGARGAAIADCRQPADNHRPRAAERGGDDNHVALQHHRADRADDR